MSSRRLALVAVLTASVAASAAVGSGLDVLSLPWADARNGNDLGPVWSGALTPPQPLIPWGDALLHLPGCVVVSGHEPFSGFSGAVWIWRIDDSNDPLARYGPRLDQTLVPIDADRNPLAATGFGASLAGGERWLFVGAPETSVDGAPDAGAVHVFHRDTVAEPWTAFGILPNPRPALDRLYGASLAFDGATLVVGVPVRRAEPDAASTGGADLYDVADTSLGKPRSFAAPLVAGVPGNVGRRAAVAGDMFALSDPLATVIGGSGVVVVAATSDLSVSTILTTPSAQQGTMFGDGLSMSGDRLAIGAPKEDVDGMNNVGIVRLYSREGTDWIETHSVVGAQEGAQFGALALDGAFLAVGAPFTGFEMGGFTATGTCTLYRIDESVLKSLATAAPSFTDETIVRWHIGARVALGHGRWSYAEEIATGPAYSDSVRTVPIDAARTDCDLDDVSDLHEVLAGARDDDSNGVPDDCVSPPHIDCDNDGLADSSTTMLAPSISTYDAGTATWWGFYGSMSVDRAVLWIVSREVPSATDGVLRGVEADWVSAYDLRGQPVIVAAYDDPNQDGDPSDAVYRGAYLAQVSATAGKDRALFPPIPIGPPGTKYFLGVGLIVLKSANATLFLRAENPSGGPFTPMSWVAAGTDLLASELNVETPQMNATFEPSSTASDWACVGLFHPPIDRDGNGVPGPCECPADLDGDATVGAGDLAILLGAWAERGPSDLDGDGIVGAADLAMLLAAWGGCAVPNGGTR